MCQKLEKYNAKDSLKTENMRKHCLAIIIIIHWFKKKGIFFI